MKDRFIPIANEGWAFIIPIFLLALLAAILGAKIVGFIFLCLSFFIIYFFRDPFRKIPEQDNIFVSPADGKIIRISKINNDCDLYGDCILVSIFMSIFNVHINRVPCDGTIEEISYNPGKFMPAFREKASLLNEQNSVRIVSGKYKLLVRQIAGLIARRIVCKVKQGDMITKGAKLGLIKFGSRVYSR